MVSLKPGLADLDTLANQLASVLPASQVLVFQVDHYIRLAFYMGFNIRSSVLTLVH